MDFNQGLDSPVSLLENGFRFAPLGRAASRFGREVGTDWQPAPENGR